MNLTSFSQHQQLFLDLNISIPFEVTDHEAALLILLQNLDYSDFHLPKKKSGRPHAADPYTMMLIIIYARIQGRFSSREVERLCKRDIFLLQILKDRKVPDHTTFDRFIRRHEKAIDGLFFQVAKRLDSLGELEKDVIYQDGTKMESKAGRYSFVWKKATTKNLAKLHRHIETLIAEANRLYCWNLEVDDCHIGLNSLIESLKGTGLALTPEKTGRGHHLSDVQKFYRDALKYKEKLENYEDYLGSMDGRNSMSKTDPDATFMRMKDDYMRNGQLKPAYNLQVLVDSGYIVGSYASADRTDYATMVPALDHMHKSLPWKYSKYCADSGYDSQQNYEYLENHQIAAYIKPQGYEQSKKRTYRNDIGRKENMTYNAEQDCFICSRGKKLEHQYIRKRKNQYGYETTSHIYRCKRGCKTCPSRSACMKRSKASYKQVQVNHKLREYHRQVLKLITSDEGVEIRVNRSIQAEGAFAQIKANWSFRRFLHSGMGGIHTDWLLMCLAMNAVRLGNRLARDEVGSPFRYILPEEVA
ncbi:MULTISPECIES: IS1182 family transposase [unclassified Oceanispirochaeta]|uniref:IS1182 family transposase n=1 Tax=unclassified Oceanispirochaeta TaxID=2635722 RepID=UPI00131461BE|nr:MULTISPECIES: IS1182 family transposase [unclassified Oceanispirochaeta]MBF9019034.1 IS1182 family transposase [Oceanispirochaeta sp. M2]NPD75537.1 IS1182 family transposase [Oceanispirochaeta sp. M1]